MSARELREIARGARVAGARRSPAMMGRFVQGAKFSLRAHTKIINDALVDLGKGTDRLMITLPPRSGKSELIAKLLPFWWLTNHPHDRVIVGSYAAALAIRHSRATRRMVEEYGASFDLHLQPGDQAVADWSLTTGGGVRAAGVGGGLTGHGGSLAVGDDLMKSRQQADSRLYRDRAWDWWSDDFLSRLTPGAPVCLVNTRWHVDDVVARAINLEGRIEEGGRWKVIELEAIATGTKTDPLGRTVGEPLTHPLIPDEDTEALLAHWEDKRRTSIPRAWASLYQGTPVVAEGALVDAALLAERTYLTGHPEVVRAAVAVDPSGGGKDSAGVVAGFLGADGRVWLSHDRTRVMASDVWSRTACLLAFETDATKIIYERNYGGDMITIAIRTAWQALTREGTIPPSTPMPYLQAVQAKKGKLLRAEPVAQFYREDKLRHAAHMPELVTEWCGWTPGDTDSPGRIDASVYLALDLMPPVGAGRTVSSPVGISRDQFRGGGASRRF